MANEAAKYKFFEKIRLLLALFSLACLRWTTHPIYIHVEILCPPHLYPRRSLRLRAVSPLSSQKARLHGILVIAHPFLSSSPFIFDQHSTAVIGEGAYGVVYKGHSKALGRGKDVAIKKVRREDKSCELTFWERFLWFSVNYTIIIYYQR